MNKLFYIYDKVSENYLYFCESSNDAVAMRSFNTACASEFKQVANDLSLVCLGSRDGSTLVPDYVKVCDFRKEPLDD